MVGLGAVPAGIQCFLILFLPESRECREFLLPHPSTPNCIDTARILIRRGNFEAAQRVLGKTYAYATPEQVSLKVNMIMISYALM